MDTKSFTTEIEEVLIPGKLPYLDDHLSDLEDELAIQQTTVMLSDRMSNLSPWAEGLVSFKGFIKCRIA